MRFCGYNGPLIQGVGGSIWMPGCFTGKRPLQWNRANVALLCQSPLALYLTSAVGVGSQRDTPSNTRGARSSPRSEGRGVPLGNWRGSALKSPPMSFDILVQRCFCNSVFRFTMLPVCWARLRTSSGARTDITPKIICARRSPRSRVEQRPRMAHETIERTAKIGTNGSKRGLI